MLVFSWIGQLPHLSDFGVHFPRSLVARASANCAHGLAEVFMEASQNYLPARPHGQLSVAQDWLVQSRHEDDIRWLW